MPAMRISVTERQTKKRCLRKWDLSSNNRQSLTPVVNAPALDFGTIWHAVLAQWTLEPNTDPQLIYTDIANKFLKQVITNYTERIGCKPSVDELKPILELVGMGKSMIERYKQHWHTPLPAGFTLIENELTLVQDVPNTDHCTIPGHKRDCPMTGPDCYPTYHQLECTFDGVMADANGDLFIIERKTYSRTPALEELERNDQFLAYMWALNTQMPGKVTGVAYDGAMKNIKRNLEECFLRRILLHSEAELSSFENHLVYEVQDMYRLSQYPHDHPALYPTIPPVMGCQRWECSFIDLCKAMEHGNESEQHRLRSMYIKTDRKRFLDNAAHAAANGSIID